jgi:hypothetical protein
MRQILFISLALCAAGINLKREEKDAKKLKHLEKHFEAMLEPTKGQSSFLQNKLDAKRGVAMRKPKGDLINNDGLILEKAEEALSDKEIEANLAAEATYFESFDGDVNDRLDRMQRDVDQLECMAFNPSANLAAMWKKAKASLKNSTVETTDQTLPEHCKADIQKRKMTDPTCADPWPLTKDCSKSYEIPNYRLGDLFFELSVSGYSYKQNRDWTNFYFPESVGSRYLHEKKKTKDYEALWKVLSSEKYDKYEKPDKDTVVLHLRAYDIYVFGAQAGYTKSAAHYEKVAEKAKKAGMKKLVIVTGDHWVSQRKAGVTGYVRTNKAITDATLQKAIEMSDKKRAEVRGAFETKGFQVQERVNGNADCDFVYMSNARHFVPSHGNFGGLTFHMVSRNNGTVYLK